MQVLLHLQEIKDINDSFQEEILHLDDNTTYYNNTITDNKNINNGNNLSNIQTSI